MSVKLGNTNIAGTQVLYSITGNNTDGAMTQAATSTALNNKADNSVVNLKANDSDVVHKTGNETITGTKTILTELLLYQLNSTSDHMHFVRGSAPSSGTGKGIYIPFDDYDNIWHKIMSDFNFQVVSTLPVYPNSNVYYFIPE